jgi:hypothetical protein
LVDNLLDGSDGFVCESLVLEHCYLLVLFGRLGRGETGTY